MFFDPMYFLYVAPALLLAFWAQYRVRSAYAEAQQVPAGMSGAEAARRVLDAAGLHNVEIEPVPGELSDHYDPRDKVLRLSSGVYGSRSMAAVGIAAHEAGHALQDAMNYAPLVVRNLAVPAASFGSGISYVLLIAGFLLHISPLIWLGILLFGCVVFFQLVNLPVEFDASARAKDELMSLGIIDQNGLVYVRRVLNAAAWTMWRPRCRACSSCFITSCGSRATSGSSTGLRRIRTRGCLSLRQFSSQDALGLPEGVSRLCDLQSGRPCPHGFSSAWPPQAAKRRKNGRRGLRKVACR